MSGSTWCIAGLLFSIAYLQIALFMLQSTYVGNGGDTYAKAPEMQKDLL